MLNWQGLFNTREILNLHRKYYFYVLSDPFVWIGLSGHFIGTEKKAATIIMDLISFLRTKATKR